MLTHFTKLDIFILYPISYLTDAVKCLIGVLVVRTGYWAQNIVTADIAADLSGAVKDQQTDV